ncbi:MAG: TetR/AcrR family transcriptional regulator [Myxococcales bacterium]|nr:TetR/AcrR family transcriptional regulator [Myxococcales bacterium]
MTQAGGWQREAQPDLAVERILDAADEAFARHGVSSVGMARIAEFAGCSRGTLYRYFPTRHALHAAYVDRAALRVIARVRERLAGIRDPRERLAEGILASVAEVRAHPGTAAWFAGGAQASAARMSRASELVVRLTRRFVAEIVGPASGDAESRLGASWLVRVILSLLSNPGADDAEERRLVERFATPGFFGR